MFGETISCGISFSEDMIPNDMIGLATDLKYWRDKIIENVTLLDTQVNELDTCMVEAW